MATGQKGELVNVNASVFISTPYMCTCWTTREAANAPIGMGDRALSCPDLDTESLGRLFRVD
jgi:hypothetical protein